MEFWNSGILEAYISKILKSWNFGILESWNYEIMESVILEFKNLGILDSWNCRCCCFITVFTVVWCISSCYYQLLFLLLPKLTILSQK